MKSQEEILNNNKNVYLYKDKVTFDVEVSNDNKTLLEELKTFICLVCEKNILFQKDREITESNLGVYTNCESCKQKYFIHKPIIIPENLK